MEYNDEYASKIAELAELKNDPIWEFLAEQENVGFWSAWLIHYNIVTPTPKAFIWIDKAYTALTETRELWNNRDG